MPAGIGHDGQHSGIPEVEHSTLPVVRAVVRRAACAADRVTPAWAVGAINRVSDKPVAFQIEQAVVCLLLISNSRGSPAGNHGDRRHRRGYGYWSLLPIAGSLKGRTGRRRKARWFHRCGKQRFDRRPVHRRPDTVQLDRTRSISVRRVHRCGAVRTISTSIGANSSTHTWAEMARTKSGKRPSLLDGDSLLNKLTTISRSSRPRSHLPISTSRLSVPLRDGRCCAVPRSDRTIFSSVSAH